MLITTSNSDMSLPVGILIKKAILSETEWQGFVLYTFQGIEKKIEIGISDSKYESMRIIALEYEMWKRLEDDVYGYPQPTKIEEEVYLV